jgi:hypothetical protein
MKGGRGARKIQSSAISALSEKSLLMSLKSRRYILWRSSRSSERLFLTEALVIGLIDFSNRIWSETHRNLDHYQPR